jgi:hypothetical protein
MEASLGRTQVSADRGAESVRSHLQALPLAGHVREDGSPCLEGVLQHLLASTDVAHGLGFVVQASVPGPIPACSCAAQELLSLCFLYAFPGKGRQQSTAV